RNPSGFADEEHRLLLVEDIDLEVEGAREQGAAVSGLGARENERGASDERRVLERERHIVERVEVHEPLVGGEERRIRIGLEGERAGRELALPRRRQRGGEIAIPELSEIEHERLQQAARDRRAEAIQQDR